MSQQHIEALATLANMHYMASQIHARTPIVDREGTSIVDHMNKATDHLTESMAHSINGHSESSLFSLRSAVIRTQGVLKMLHDSMNHQVDAAREGRLHPNTVVSNINDATAFVDLQNNLTNKGKEIVANEQAKTKGTRDMVDNARDVIEGIADENNLLLPGNWTRHGDEPAPNGE